MDNKVNKKLVSFRLSEELLQALRDRADKDGVTVTELVTRLLKYGLKTSDDDRITALEAEVEELRQYKQLNFNGLSAVPVYPPSYPYPPEQHIKQYIEHSVKAHTKDELAEIKSMLKEVLKQQATNKYSA